MLWRSADAGIETAAVVTPHVSVAALRHGYPLEVHPQPEPRQSHRPVRLIPTPDARRRLRMTRQVPMQWRKPMRTLTLRALREEIKRHLRVNPVRHGRGLPRHGAGA